MWAGFEVVIDRVQQTIAEEKAKKNLWRAFAKKNTFLFDKIVVFVSKQILQITSNIKNRVEYEAWSIWIDPIYFLVVQAGQWFEAFWLVLPSSLGWGIVMDGAPDHYSSLHPILLVILSSFVERPVVGAKSSAELTLRTGGALEPCTAAANEPLFTGQIWPYWPVDFARFDKEVANKRAFQFENLWQNKDV